MRLLRLFRTPLVLVASLLAGTMACAPQQDPQTVVMLIEFSPTSLDPRVGTDAQSERIGELIFDSLLYRDEHSNLQPWLAERWEVVDPLTYVFHLRSDVRFHDGRPLTARDARYTFQSLLSGEIRSLKASSFSRIAAVEAPDDRTLIIRLHEPYASFLWNVTQGAIGIVPEGAPQDFGRQPVGTGPFRFVAAAQDEHVLVERNPDYWGQAPHVERVSFRVVPDATTRALELRKGSADIALNALTADMVEALRDEPGLQVTQQPGNSYQYLSLNLAEGRFPIPVRQAIAHAINREELIAYLWRNLVRPANSILPEQHWAYAPGLDSYEYAPAKAERLLDEAGLGRGFDGIRMRLEMKTSTDQSTRELASVLQTQLARVGIELLIRSYEFATFYGDVTKGSFDLFSLRWVGASNADPDILEYCFASDKVPPAGANRSRYSNPAVDRLLELGRTSISPDERRDAYHRVQEILNRELPYIHLWYLDNVAVHSRRITNLHMFPTGNYDFLREIRIPET